MGRQFLVSLAIGLVVALPVLAFYEAGLFPWLGAHLFRLYSGFRVTVLPSSAVPWMPLQWALIGVGAVGGAWVSMQLARAGRSIMVGVLSCIVLLLASPVAALFGFLFEPYSGCIAVIGGLVGGCLYLRGEAARRRRAFRDLFAGRISANRLAELERVPFGLNLNGENRPLSILVCRVLNHDELRENMRAREVIALVEHLFAAASDSLLQSGAYIDATAPGNLRVCFGLPLAAEDHAEQACRAALNLRARLAGWAKECEERWRERVEWGIGIASGELTVGMFGESGAPGLSALGEGPDIARRLSENNRSFSSAVLVSAATFEAAGESMLFRPMEILADQGGGGAAEIYELVAERGALSDEEEARRESFWHGLVHLRGGNAEAALREFEAARPADGEDLPVERYIALAQERLEDQSGAGARSAGAGAAPRVEN